MTKYYFILTIHSLAVTNVLLGTFLLFGGYSALFWVFLGYSAFNLILFIVLLLLFTLKSALLKSPGQCSPSLVYPGYTRLEF